MRKPIPPPSPEEGRDWVLTIMGVLAIIPILCFMIWLVVPFFL
jgi:hypothetical protein